MAIRGNMSEASLADVLQLLSLGQKTGVLSLAREGQFGAIHFERGWISNAMLVNRKDTLADRLLRSGCIDADLLAKAQSDLGRDDDRELAFILLDRSLVDKDILADECRSLTEDALCDLFTWDSGTFAFEPTNQSETRTIVLLSADSLLMEAARRVDEWSQIRTKVQSLDLIFEIDTERLRKSGVQLDSNATKVASLLDGTRDVNDVIRRTGLSEFVVGKAIFELLASGIAQRVGRSVLRAQQAPESRLAEHRNLGIAFYRTRMYADSLREFRRILELRNEDISARFYIGLIHIQERKWMDAVHSLQLASSMPESSKSVLLALAYAQEKHGDWDSAASTLSAAAKMFSGIDPKVSLSQAVLAMKQGDMARANERLEAARLATSGHPSSVWYHYAALVSALQGDVERASVLLEEGIGVYPESAILHNNLAAIQERCGLYEAAAHTIDHALLCDTSLPHLHKNLGDYYYRSQQYDSALECYERVVRLSSEHGVDVWLKLGNIQYRMGEKHKAIASWKKALELDPDNAIARNNLDAGFSSDSVSYSEVGKV